MDVDTNDAVRLLLIRLFSHTLYCAHRKEGKCCAVSGRSVSKQPIMILAISEKNKISQK